MVNEVNELNAFLSEHQATPDGCACGWRIDQWDYEHPWMMTPTWAWTEHVKKASYARFRQRKQYVEATGPDGAEVAFVLDRGLLHHHHRGSSLEFARKQRETYRYQYDDYEPEQRDDGSRHLTCEEAGCRNPTCLGGHFSFTLTFPDVCAGCHKPFKDDEERVGRIRQPSTPRQIEDGSVIATTASYHVDCDPTDEEFAAQPAPWDA